MSFSIPSVIVIQLKDLGWFSRHDWLGSGISNTLTEKLRVLPFIRVFSLLALDLLLDSRGLTGTRPKDEVGALKVLKMLPVTVWMIYGTMKIRGDDMQISSHIISQDRHTRDANWSGQYIRLLEGINIISVGIAEGLAQMASASQPTVKWDRTRFEKAGLPSSLQAYEAFCRATHSRAGSEKAMFYHEAIRFDSTFASAYAGFGTHHARHGRLSDAIACFKKQLEITPHDHQGHSSLGMAYGDQGFYESALQEFRTALELYPQGDPDVFSNLGAIYHQMEQFDEALDFYRKGLELNPGDGDIHFNIAKCLLAQNAYAGRHEARVHLQKALEFYGPMFAEKRRRVLAILSELPR